MSGPYVELHARSAFSFLQGASAPEDLVSACAELGIPAMALLDRDGVYGAPRFHMAAKKTGMLVGGRHNAAAYAMVGVVRFNEAVIRQIARGAISLKLVELPEKRRLVLEDESHAEGPAGRIVVVDLSSAPLSDHAFVDRLIFLAEIEQVHVGLSERGAEMREGAVGNRGSRKGREPAVEHKEIRGESGNHRDLLGREAVHDVVRVRKVVLLLVIRLDEALHVGSGGAGIHLVPKDRRLRTRRDRIEGEQPLRGQAGGLLRQPLEGGHQQPGGV